jgi:hypothetical protein
VRQQLIWRQNRALHKPFDRSAEQQMQVMMQLVSHTAERGQGEVQVYRFPNALCGDRGRRIKNSESEWETTLEGRPKFAYEFWRDHLRFLAVWYFFTKLWSALNIYRTPRSFLC